MDATAIVERLRARFSDKVGELVTDNPDPYVTVDKGALVEIGRFLRTEPEIALDFLECVTGLDLGDKLVVVYHLFSYQHRHAIVLRVETSRDTPEVPSVSGVWSAANWHEREQYDMFGITFAGHPDLRRILLPEDWAGYPLRKDYEEPKEYHGISHYRPDPLDQYKRLDLAQSAPSSQENSGNGGGSSAPSKGSRVASVTENAGA